MYMETKTAQDDEEEDVQELSSSTSGEPGPKGGPYRGPGGGARGGRTLTNTGKNHPKDPMPVGSIKQSRDADGINNYQQTDNGKLITNHRGHPLCNYCGIPSHQRSTCRIRLRDVENCIKRNTHPARDNLTSGNQIRREAQTNMANAADEWGNPWTAQRCEMPIYFPVGVWQAPFENSRVHRKQKM